MNRPAAESITVRLSPTRTSYILTAHLNHNVAPPPPRQRAELTWHRPTTGYCVVYAGRDGTARLAAKNRAP